MRGLNTDSDRDVIKRAVSQANEMVEHVSDYLKQIDRQMRGQAHQLRGQAQHAQRHVERTLSDAQRHSQWMSRNATDYVQNHPWTSVGIAVVVGAILAALFRR